MRSELVAVPTSSLHVSISTIMLSQSKVVSSAFPFMFLVSSASEVSFCFRSSHLKQSPTPCVAAAIRSCHHVTLELLQYLGESRKCLPRSAGKSSSRFHSCFSLKSLSQWELVHTMFRILSLAPISLWKDFVNATLWYRTVTWDPLRMNGYMHYLWFLLMVTDVFWHIQFGWSIPRICKELQQKELFLASCLLLSGLILLQCPHWIITNFLNNMITRIIRSTLCSGL